MNKIVKLVLLSLFLCLGVKPGLLAKENDKRPTIKMRGGDFGTPNPFKHSPRGPGRYKMEILYDALLEKDEKGMIPWLAKSWKISEDGKEVTYQLPSNAKWHDGKPLTAHDVKFTIEYYDKHPAVLDFIHENGKLIVKEAKVISDTEIKVVFNAFSKVYFNNFGNMRILPKHIWEKVEDPIHYKGAGYLVGSGPYKFSSYSPEQGTYAFDAFDDYWGLKPAANRLEWVPVSNKVLALENGEIDIARISPGMLNRFKDNSDYGININHSFHSYRLLFNPQKVQELAKKEIRQAIAFSINKENLVKKLERGYGQVGNMGYLLPSHEMYNPNVKKYQYSVDEAKKLLKDTKIEAEILVSNKGKEIKIAELIKLDLEKVGINLKIKSVDSKTRDHRVKNGKYSFAILKYGGMGGDADLLRKVYSSDKSKGLKGVFGYQNKDLDKLFDQQLHENDKEKRKKIIWDIQNIIADDIPMIPLYGEKYIYVYRKNHYNGWRIRFDHTIPVFPKLSFLVNMEQKN